MTMPRRAAMLLLGLSILQACAPGEKRGRGPSLLGRTIVALYTEVEGVSFSTDGEPYARFTDFIDREECRRLTLDEVTKIIDSLEREGFFKESNRALTGRSRSQPPAQFRICVASPGRSKECLFLCEKSLNVPLRYREIFETLPMSVKPAALERWLSLNQHCER
ncbi:MAG: hypothetical protein HY293_00830 [Planctomycetes bacterium]|nr:hypothetical protein [Planctomycetota bacterium]